MDHLAAALAYASQGVQVFLLAPRSKQPLISAANGGRGLHDATADPEVIKRWFQDHPTANIGLTTGVSFDVFDLDGEAAIDALEEARAGRERLRGPVVKTGKGYHYLVLPTGLGNRAGILPGVDFRGRGGYIVAPPSVHPDGQRYQWINPLLEDLAPAPAWLLELMTTERVIKSLQPSAGNHPIGIRTCCSAPRARTSVTSCRGHTKRPLEQGRFRPRPARRHRCAR